MRGRGWLALVGCLAVMVMLGLPVLADASDGTSVLNADGLLLDSNVLLTERPEASVPPDPGLWLGEEYAVVKPKTSWCKIDNAEAAVPVDPGSMSYEPGQDYSGSKLVAIVGGVVGLSLYFGCYTIRS